MTASSGSTGESSPTTGVVGEVSVFLGLGRRSAMVELGTKKAQSGSWPSSPAVNCVAEPCQRRPLCDADDTNSSPGVQAFENALATEIDVSEQTTVRVPAACWMVLCSWATAKMA